LSKIKEIYLNNFRIFKDRKFYFKDGINIIYGGNGKGKTTLLEAIYYLNFGKSFRTNRVSDMARGEGFSAIVKIYEGSDFVVETVFERGKVKKLLDGKKVKFSELLDLFFVIFVNSERIFNFFKERKEKRRLFNYFVAGIDNLYINYLLNYNKTLRNKSLLLKKGEINKAVYEVWSEQLDFYGLKIRERREKLVKEINEMLLDEGIEIKVVAVGKKPNLDEEIRRKRVLSGPHLDNFIIQKDKKNIFIYGSKGIWKIVYFRVIEKYIELFTKRKGKKPILLIDDFDSDLDGVNLLKSIKTFKTQTLLTFVSDSFDLIKNYNLVEV